jgi:toxin ParE1/3/4
MRIRWTQPALDDFKTISHRIEHERNLDTANRMCRSIYNAIQLLRRHPYSGRRGTKEGTRELVILKSPYLAVYRQIGEAIEILRIYHGAQQR